MDPSAPRAPVIPRATYRLQFNADFTFEHAAALVAYLDRLGISHCYASPYLKARSGSRHGYDIVNPNALNPEVGGDNGFQQFAAALRARGMGQILDIVPNHMGVGADNPWWWDVLENGPASVYAEFFDIDWRPPKGALQGKVLLPVLGESCGAELGNKKLKLDFDAHHGVFRVCYYERTFPIDPQTYAHILERDASELEATLGSGRPHLIEYRGLIAEFRSLPGRSETDSHKARERDRVKEVCKRKLADLCKRFDAIEQHIVQNTTAYNQANRVLLQELLEQQAYRLSHWRAATHEINYRRFFDISDLAGLRMESPRVFQATHRLIAELVSSGQVQGLRVDHPDGLYDPGQYFERLRTYTARQASTDADGSKNQHDPGQRVDDTYVVAEKILASHERLRSEWPIQGTTGYEFANQVNGLLIDPSSEQELRRTYMRFVDAHMEFDELLYRCKKLVMETMLASELNALANELNRISELAGHSGEFTAATLRSALSEIVAFFPVYRTYVRDEHISAEDRRTIERAIDRARTNWSTEDIGVFDFIREVLLLKSPHAKSSAHRELSLRFPMRFQQFTAPVMAKGLEDTSFYRYNPLVSLNEVGGDPRQWGLSVSAFHQANQERARTWPQTMLSTSTHDSKRSEDVRARINAISEMPREWHKCVMRWRQLNRRKRSKVNQGWAPSRNDEYLLYQTLLGAWPLEPMDEEQLAAFAERIQSYMLKAVREAKEHTSWIDQDAAYEEALRRFVRAVLRRPDRNAFLADFEPFCRRISRLGMFNSLTQTFLKLVSPGVPDIYQGNEVWDFSLVDPDNRRPVGYASRAQLLSDLEQWASQYEGTELRARVRQLLATLEDGRAKLYLTYKTLGLRRRWPDLFERGTYEPLATGGPTADHLCAFARRHGERLVVCVASRWFTKLMADQPLPLGEAVWRDTWIEMPERIASGSFWNTFTGETLTREAAGDMASGAYRLTASSALERFPVALLAWSPEGGGPMV